MPQNVLILALFAGGPLAARGADTGWLGQPVWSLGENDRCTLCTLDCVCSPNYPNEYIEGSCTMSPVRAAPISVDSWGVESGESSSTMLGLNAQTKAPPTPFPWDYMTVQTDNFLYAFDGYTAGPVGYTPSNGNVTHP